MIQLVESSSYKLVETKNNLKALILDTIPGYLWTNVGCDGSLDYTKLDTSQICCILSANNYRLYEVANEPNLKNGLHLELYVGKRKWQAYLLTKGFPTPKNKKRPISKIDEVITKVRRKYL